MPSRTGEFYATMRNTTPDGRSRLVELVLWVSPGGMVPGGWVSSSYSETFAVPDWSPAEYFVVKGTLPPGWSIKNNGNGTATISGTPTQAGVYWFELNDVLGMGDYFLYEYRFRLEIHPPF